jgi:hypothetical protein
MARENQDDPQKEHWDFLIPDFSPRAFSLEEANLALPDVIRITEETLTKLSSAGAHFQQFGLRRWSPVSGMIEEDAIKADWVGRIARLGALPKGFFTVDFASREEGTFYCWTQGESQVAHQHKAWEGFSDRVPVTSEPSVN